MPRTRRHITTSSSANSTEGPHHSTGPGTSMQTPQMNAQVEEVATQMNAQVQEVATQMNAQVQEDGPLHQSAVESDEPQLFRGSKRTTRTWDVQIRDGNGELKRQKIRAIDVYSLPPGEKVVVEWNSRNQPVELSVGMLAQFLGHIASNCQNFPIGFEKWQKIPECYKDHVWNNIIKTKLEVNDDGHKRYIFKSLAKKWRDNRCNLYSLAKCDPDGPREANIARRPPEIPLEQWVAFVDYRARPDTKAKAEQNTINRTHQTMPHTLGSKSIDRLENEMEKQLGRSITRAELFQASHTTSEGSFVNEEARHNHEDLIIRSQGSYENEAFTSVFGKEHPGYVRGMGLGVVPTQVYGSSSSTSRRNEASGGTQAEFNELKDTVHLLRQQVQENEQRFQQQIAILTQQLASQNQNIPTNQENVGSPIIGRRSSQGSHTAQGNQNSDGSM